MPGGAGYAPGRRSPVLGPRRLTERYCVIFQTLARAPTLAVSRTRR